MFEEQVVLRNGSVMEIFFRAGKQCRLSCKIGKKLLIEYRGDGAQYRKTVHGRESAYTFKSVEQLRYDFERDAEDAQRQG